MHILAQTLRRTLPNQIMYFAFFSELNVNVGHKHANGVLKNFPRC